MNHTFRKYLLVDSQKQIPVIKFKTNFTNCILQAFEQRQYEKVEDDSWDIIWSEKEFIPELYQKRLLPHQKINHFKNYYELCRKDQLIKNLKKHKKNLQKQGKTAEASNFNFYPQTFVLPNQYMFFADEFKKTQSQQQKKVWIMKPTGRSQGKGIFLFNKLSQVSNWQHNMAAEPYIVQRYINNPLLIGGKKFDMRLYALVTSYSPLTVYIYRGGFARFTHSRYDDTKIQNFEIHLTNVAVQKMAQGYDEQIGGKWYIDQLKLYMLSKFGVQATKQCFYKTQQVMIKTLQAMQKIMASQRNNSFQLYGFDILLDSSLEPWLIEVNGSPSMTANTQKDRHLKQGLLDDVLSVLDMEKFLLGNEEQIGGFDRVCKGKVKNPQMATQKVSFLGTYNNREQNLRKIAKSYAPRLNTQLKQKGLQNKKRTNSSNGTGNPSLNSSKRNIMNRRLYVPSQMNKILQNCTNSNNVSTNNIKVSSNNQSNKNSAKNHKDFIIKQKIKRQYTNENDLNQ